jgi:hypothetical protein
VHKRQTARLGHGAALTLLPAELLQIPEGGSAPPGVHMASAFDTCSLQFNFASQFHQPGSQAGLTPDQRAYTELDDITDARHRTDSVE